MKTVLPLSAFCTIASMFLRRLFYASNSSLGKFSSRVLPAILYDEKAESLSLVYDEKAESQRTPTHLQTNFKVLILNLWWPALVHGHSLRTLVYKKQLTCALKICSKIRLMLIIYRKTLSVSCLLGPCLNHWPYLIRNSINNMMELQWVSH